jgi:Zn-dependent protease with chaperone function
LHFASPAWNLLALLLILNLRWAARLRDWACRRTRREWLQGFYLLPPLIVLLSVMELPPAIVAHHVSLAYGQSIQAWRSWTLDWTKGLLLDLLVGTLVLSAVFAMVRTSKHWWLWVWLLSLPLQVFAVFILPVVVDPLFDHFEPLNKSNPELVQQLEAIVAKTGLNIPPSRMYLMRASEKYTGSNAYVTGFGSSKRVVVWDTTVGSSPTDETLFIFGHELGHYVLNHIVHGLIFSGVLSFFFLWLGYHFARFLVWRYGPSWRIATLEDWASAIVLLLVVSLLSFLAQPMANGISRWQEHQADVFGEEILHGVVADPQQTAARSFQRLGEQSLDYPAPCPFIVFWSYSHPPIAARVAFAASYDPWTTRKQPRYFK